MKVAPLSCKHPLNPFLDKKGGILTPRKSVVKTIESLQGELDLVDIWRIKNPAKKSFTWGQNSPMVFCRLDYWLISNSLYDSVTGTDIVPAIKTDHSAILLEFCNNVNDIGQFQKISIPNHGRLPCFNPPLPSEIPKCITPPPPCPQNSIIVNPPPVQNFCFFWKYIFDLATAL